MNHSHEIIVRIYYQDTDFGGVVHHSNYLSYAERGRCEYFRDRFGEFDTLMRARDLNIVARHVNVSFHAPARLDDQLRVVTYVHKIGNSSFVIHSDMFVEDRAIAEVHMTGVMVNGHFKATRIPDDIKERMS